MARTTLFAAGYVAAAVTDSYLAGQAGTTARRLRVLTKPALMPLLSACCHGATTTSTERGLLAAHALSWGGDVALLASGERAFLTGLGSFFGAHLAYLATFASHRARTGPQWNRSAKVALGVWAAAAPGMSLAARHRDPVLALPVALYATALAALLASAGQLDGSRDPRAAREVLAGTSLFLASDTLLGARTFLLTGDRRGLETAVMASYTVAQALIARGLTRL